MRGRAAAARLLPEGTYSIALKAEAEVVEDSLNDLLWDMNVYRYAVQRIVDTLWELDKLPTLNQAHQLFYRVLREQYGLLGRTAKQAYKYALALVKGARKNGGSKPVLRRLSVRLDMYQASLDAENWLVRVNIRGKRYTLKLKHDPGYLSKYKGRRWYEVIVKWEHGRLWIVIPFRWEYKPYKPGGVIALDANLRDVAVYDGASVRFLATRFDQALGLKKYAEKVQKKHPRTWKRSRRLLERVRRYHRRSRNIVLDSVRKLALNIVRRARRMGYAVAVEDLAGLWRGRSRNGPSRLTRVLSRFAYGKLMQTIIAKAVEHGVPLLLVDPRGTSTTCPRCGSKLEADGRTVHCPRCGLWVDRDYAAAMNIHRRAMSTLTGMRGALGSPDRGAR